MRITGSRRVEVDCPVCGVELPPILVEFDARADGPRTLGVEFREPLLTPEWWAQVRATHPGCPPDRAP